MMNDTLQQIDECELFNYTKEDAHIVYKNLFTNAANCNVNRGLIAYIRQSVSDMWSKFKHLADSNFVSHFPIMPDQRYWEMYLGCCLIDRGFSVTSKDSGPDFCINIGERKIWIEAVTASLGKENNPDRVPEPVAKIASAAPRDKIILRYISSITEKIIKYQKYATTNIFSDKDIKIIAVSHGDLRRVGVDSDELPYIIGAVFPVGSSYLTIDTQTGDELETGRHYQAEIIKAKGKPVGKELFADPSYEDISAIIYSNSDVANIPNVWGSDIIVIHNPLARNPLPRGLLKFPLEYWVEEHPDHFCIKRVRY